MKADLEVLKSANWQVLFNGAERLGLNDRELSEILHLNYKTVNDWHNRADRKLPCYDLSKAEGVFIKAFMDLYVNLRSWYVDPNDPRVWLRSSNKLLNGKTPFEFMKSEPIGIFKVNDYLQARMGI